MANEYQGFINYTARLVRPGAIEWDSSGEMTLTDIYAVTIPKPNLQNDDPAGKWRPLGYDIYQTGSTTPIARKNVSNIPARNSQHPDYTFMRAVNIRWSQPDNASTVWTCEVNYKYSPASRDQQDPEEPAQVTKFIDVEFYSHNITVPLSYTTGGRVLCTTAGEPITPEPIIDVASPCLRITARNKRPPSTYASYMGTLNSSGITICGLYFPKYTGRLTFSSRETEVVLGGTTQDPQTDTYYEHTFCIEGNLTPAPQNATFEQYGGIYYAGWAKVIPNMGYSYLDQNNVLTRAMIASEINPAEKVPSPMPVALDDYGHRLNSSVPGMFVVFPAGLTNWANIGFPATW